MLNEWNESTRLQPASQLELGACTLGVTLRGAIADFDLHQTIQNPGPGELAAAYELELPAAAVMIGASFDNAPAIGVAVNPAIEKIDSTDVLGADPAFVLRVGNDAGRVRYRAIVQPVRAEREVSLALRWTETAEIHDGALHAKLLGRIDGSKCTVTVKAQPGPGATVSSIAAAGAPLPRSGAFVWSADDVMISVALAMGKAPIAWLQTTDLGDGETARALTVIAPAVRAETGAHRVLFVIDTSRSMELVGRNNVRRLVGAISSALPQGSTIEAILFDRRAERVLKAWQPAETATSAIDQALAKHGAVNGSDLVGAFALANTALAEPTTSHAQAMVITITDGVFGGVATDALAKALGGRTETIDVHALVLDPHAMSSPDGDAIHPLVSAYGGTYVEVAIDDLDRTIAEVSDWLRPAWQDLAVTGIGTPLGLPQEVRAGTGFVQLSLGPRTKGVTITAHGDAPVTVHATVLPAAPIAQLVLAQVDDDNLGPGVSGEQLRAKLTQHFPSIDDEHDLAVLSTVGRVAAGRRQMIAGGGPYTRMVELPDAAFPPSTTISTTVSTGGSALDRSIIKRLLNDQLQPHAYSCYARSLGRMIALAGTATFQIELGRGEVTRVTVTGFEDNAEFHACLVDAAYGLAPPMPTPGYNLDDRSTVNYPLTFSVRDKQPAVAASDAAVTPAASTPVDGRRPKLDVGDTTTPLGNVKQGR